MRSILFYFSFIVSSMPLPLPTCCFPRARCQDTALRCTNAFLNSMRCLTSRSRAYTSACTPRPVSRPASLARPASHASTYIPCHPVMLLLINHSMTPVQLIPRNTRTQIKSTTPSLVSFSLSTRYILRLLYTLHGLHGLLRPILYRIVPSISHASHRLDLLAR
ncbi:hypothetical protein BDQ17DRAFT_673547 [Cyathus striatus]|nr:hypothetical protein BDQ17DRAFT_673547 [Cyathus striatus]